MPTLSSAEFKFWMSLLIFCLVYLSNVDSWVLKSSIFVLWESKSLCRSITTCFMNLGAPALGAYIFRIVSASCCIDPFTIMWCPSLSLLIFVGLKSVLSETEIATPPFIFYFIFLLSICLVNSSICLFWAYLCLCTWDGSPEYSTPMDPYSLSNFPVFSLGHLSHLHLRLILLCVNLILPLWC